MPLSPQNQNGQVHPGPAKPEASTAPAQVPGLLQEFDPAILVYLRRLLNSQPLLRLDWETHDFFQELSSRYLLRLTGKKPPPTANSVHETALLKRLARHLFIDQLRRLRAQKRDVLRMQHLQDAMAEPSRAEDATQLDRMVRLESIESLRQKVSEDEWELLRLHSEGFGWIDIAATLGRKPNAVRMQFTRLVSKLSQTFRD